MNLSGKDNGCCSTYNNIDINDVSDLGDLIAGKRLILCLPLRKSEKEDWGTTGQSASSQSLERS